MESSRLWRALLRITSSSRCSGIRKDRLIWTNLRAPSFARLSKRLKHDPNDSTLLRFFLLWLLDFLTGCDGNRLKQNHNMRKRCILQIQSLGRLSFESHAIGVDT